MIRRRALTLALVCALMSLTACGNAGGQPIATWHAPRSSGNGGGGPVRGAASGKRDGSSVDPRVNRAAPSPSASAGPGDAPGPDSPDGPGDSGSPAPGGSGPPGGAGWPGGPGSPSPGSGTGPYGTLRRTGSQSVALTFDDGPGQNTPQILALLRAYGIKATFCLIGVKVRANPDAVRQIAADGHTLCNHSWRHDLKLGSRPSDVIRNDLQMTSDEIHKAVPGAPITYYRQPGGEWTSAVVSVARELGMTPLHWSVDPMDWNIQRWPVGETMTNHVIGVVEHNTGPGAIVLSHDGGGDRASTVAAYRVLLPWLKGRFQLAALTVS